MPDAPTLTRKQQKSALSARKNKSKETIRNVLACPYAKYWPLISTDEAESLGAVLSEHLPILVPKKLYIPRKELKSIPKSERKLFRQKYAENQTDSDKTEVGSREGLILGVNDVTKGIENGIVRCVLITSDVRPKLMVEHVIDQSVLMEIPVLVVPELRKLLKATCRISSVSIAFTDFAKYANVQQAIEQIALNYPIPRNHIHFNRLPSSNHSVIVIDDSVMDVNEIETEEDSLSKNNVSDGKEVDPETSGIYLFRKSVTERVFVPEKSSNELKNLGQQIQVDSTGFLPFAVNSTPASVPKYKSLVVKRVKGDLNRNKRKITEMKRRPNKKHKSKR